MEQVQLAIVVSSNCPRQAMSLTKSNVDWKITSRSLCDVVRDKRQVLPISFSIHAIVVICANHLEQGSLFRSIF